MAVGPSRNPLERIRHGVQLTELKHPQSSATLSVVAIAKDEQRDLPGFLANVLAMADEVVIVDDGSTDQTAQIAQLAGGKVKFIAAPKQPGEGFCDQRNKGIAHATSDWLLHMDVDERVSPELAGEIANAIQNDSFDAYRYRRLNYFLNRPMRGGGWQLWNNAQLARRRFTFIGKVHEHIDLAAARRVGQLNGKMIHLGDENFAERLRKNLHYSLHESDRLIAQGQRVNLWRMLFVPAWRAFRSYFLFFGFRDGAIGIVWALYQFCGTMTWYFLAWDRQHHRERDA